MLPKFWEHMSGEFIHCSRAKLSGAQLSTFWGRIVGPRTVGPRTVGPLDSWALGQRPSNWHISPNSWQDLSNTSIWIQLTCIPQMLAAYFQYEYKNKNIYIKEPCAQTANTHPLMYNFNWIIFPTCWQFISSTKFTFPNPAPKGFTETLQLTYIFLIFGRIYPIQIYILWYLYLYSDLRNICQLYLYILVLDISCQQLGQCVS